MTEDIEVLDGDRRFVFRGDLLGESSSWHPGKDRWIEIRIFRTIGDQYVVAGVGRSKRAHRTGCPQAKPGLPTGPLDEERIPCIECAPPLGEDALLEVDRHWAQISGEPEGVIEKLTMMDGDDVRYIPRASREALEIAIEKDERLKEAYLAPQRVE